MNIFPNVYNQIMHLIDTNIFLELLLNQEKKKIAQKILTRLEKGEIEAVISGFSLHSIAKKFQAEIITFDNDFKDIKDLKVHIF